MKKNIVFIQCDSMDGRLMGCMNHPAMGRATRNMDALAEHGVLFTDAYTTNPICCPSRASMWSGLYTHHCEGWNNYKGLEPGESTFMTVLESEGYKTFALGKTDYVSGEHTVRARVSAWTRSADIYRPNYTTLLPKLIPGQEKRVHTTDWKDVEEAVRLIHGAAATGHKPFCLYIGIRAPHHPFQTSEYYWDLIDEEGIEIPPADSQVHPCMKYHDIVNNWGHGLDEKLIRRMRRIYFAMIAEVDAMVGELVKAVDEAGLRESTHIIFTSDHGEMAMEHSQYGKMNMYEPAVRVPMIVSGPGIQNQIYTDNPVSLIDIYPTILDWACIQSPYDPDGQSLSGFLTGCGTNRRNYAFAEYHDSGVNTGCFMIRSGDWKYIQYIGYAPQLFNLREDPWEIHDCSEQKGEQKEEMESLLSSIVDYRAVDAKVKKYDKECFRQWREEQLQKGTYHETMSLIFSGYDDISPEQTQPWTDEDEKQILIWLDA